MVQDLTFRNYTAMLILSIFALGMIVNFSGGIISNYDTGGTSSETLQQLKSDAQQKSPNVGNLRNRTESVDVDEGAFLSPQGFSIIADTLGSIANLPSIASTAVTELGLPSEILILLSIPVAALMYEALSLLFGIRT